MQPRQNILSTLLLSVALIATAGLASCSNTNDVNGSARTSDGLITGFDARRCVSPCCSGWFVEIAGERYRFLSAPSSTTFDVRDISPEQYPVPVRLTWKSTSRQCAEDLIEVLRIERR